MSLSFAVLVFWSDGVVVQTGACRSPRGWRALNLHVTSALFLTRGNIGDLSLGAAMLPWKCPRGVTLHGLWTKCIWKSLSIALLQRKLFKKKTTQVYLLGTLKLFLYLLFFTRKQLCFNLTMLFNVLLTTFLWPLAMLQIIHSKLYIFVFQ